MKIKINYKFDNIKRSEAGNHRSKANKTLQNCYFYLFKNQYFKL
jgi:hypothetical protein